MIVTALGVVVLSGFTAVPSRMSNNLQCHLKIPQIDYIPSFGSEKSNNLMPVHAKHKGRSEVYIRTDEFDRTMQ
jgi:hypothetical protein